MKILCVGDAMIRGKAFAEAAERLGKVKVVAADWETNWDKLQHRRLVIEQQGPDVESVPDVFLEHNDTDIALGLFCPFSAALMDSLPDLKLIGVARAGVENVDVAGATDRGIPVFHVMGRNAEAVSDYAVGMMLSEVRNIARAHLSIHQGNWRKQFANSDYVPELKGKTVGIIGFGHIGRLVAKKLSGFDVEIVVYDPWVTGELPHSVQLVDKETLFRESDFITLHARLTEESQHLVGKHELSLMKPTAYLVNTARSGLIDIGALVSSLQKKGIAGAALDVFDIEPIPDEHELLKLDNVTLTTHIAGTTTEALTRSPELLIHQIKRFFDGSMEVSLKNPEVLKQPGVQEKMQELIDSLGRQASV